MLNINNVLWVIPGIVFIYFYNQHRPISAIRLSGWSYLFFLVFIASITWVPADIVSKQPSEWIYGWIKNKDILDVRRDLVRKPVTLSISLCITLVILYLSQRRLIGKLIPRTYDNFFEKCIEWENQAIIITLKSEKAYMGILWKYPENPKSTYESQTISIVPFMSGYRNEKTKKVIWNTIYLGNEEKYTFVDMEVLIARSEIITFRKFNKNFLSEKDIELS